MKRIAFRIVYPAVLASLSTIVLLVGSILPSGQIGFAALDLSFLWSLCWIWDGAQGQGHSQSPQF